MLTLQDVNCDVNTRLGFMEEWQDYDEIKEAYNTDNKTGNFPEWYDFYNGSVAHRCLIYSCLMQWKWEDLPILYGLQQREKNEKTGK